MLYKAKDLLIVGNRIVELSDEESDIISILSVGIEPFISGSSIFHSVMFTDVSNDIHRLLVKGMTMKSFT